jgi:hypothetical protein
MQSKRTKLFGPKGKLKGDLTNSPKFMLALNTVVLLRTYLKKFPI